MKTEKRTPALTGGLDNICTGFHGNPFNSSLDTSAVTDTAIPNAMQFQNKSSIEFTKQLERHQLSIFEEELCSLPQSEADTVIIRE